MTNPAMFTVDEAGERLGLTRSQVYRRIEQGQLVGIRARRNGKQRWLVPDYSVATYLAGGVDFGPEDSPELLRVPAAARMLGFSPEHIRKMVREGVLDAKRGPTPTSQIRILRSSIERYLTRDDVQ